MPRRLSELPLKEIEELYLSGRRQPSRRVLAELRSDPRAGARKLAGVLARVIDAASKERRRMDRMLHFERVLWKAGVQRVAGVDEVGLGPLAGPAVAAAVVFEPGVEIPGVDDSKVLDDETRGRLDVEIRRKCRDVSVNIVEVEEIDRINIYQAGLLAMRRAVEGLHPPPDHVLIDSRTIPGIPMPQNSFDKGDALSFSIAAASIVAKVFRDRLMTELDRQYPGYGFARHKGYATPEHQDAIRRLGPCALHRKSFHYIRELQGDYPDLFYELQRAGQQLNDVSGLVGWEKEVHRHAAVLEPAAYRKLMLTIRRMRSRLPPQE